MNTLKYVVKRVLLSLVILFFVALIIYTIMRCLPTSYIENIARAKATQPNSKTYEEWMAQLTVSYGMDKGIITALPMEVPVCYQEIAHCLDKTVAKIENAVLSALENTPPELYADIVKNGIWLAGGGALLRGLDRRLEAKINIPFHIAEDPLHSVAKGAGIALKNVSRFTFLMR